MVRAVTPTSVSKVIARLIDRVKEAESASMTTKDREITESVVTFAIPTLNRARSLAYLLDSITKQNYSKYEIIVIDGNSTDDTEQVVRHYGARLISVDRSTSLSRARQVGFQSARGDIVAMFDSDVILPHRGWLGNAVRLFSVSKNVSTVWCLAVAGEGKILAKAYADVTWCFSLSEFLAGRFPAGGGGSAGAGDGFSASALTVPLIPNEGRARLCRAVTFPREIEFRLDRVSPYRQRLTPCVQYNEPEITRKSRSSAICGGRCRKRTSRPGGGSGRRGGRGEW